MQASLFSWGHLLKIISSSHVTSQLPEAMITTGANKELTESLKGKVRAWAVHRGLWKTLAYSWESKRPLTCAGMCAFSEKTWEGPKLSPLTDLEALCNKKLRLRQICRLPAWVSEEFPKIQNTLANAERLIHSRHLRASVQLLTDHYQTETSVTTHNKEYKLYNISSGKSLNKLQKQQNPATTDSGGQGSGFCSCHIVLFKYPIFYRNYETCQEIRKNGPFIRKQAFNRNYP